MKNKSDFSVVAEVSNADSDLTVDAIKSNE